MITAAIHGFVLAFPLIMPLGVQNVFVFNQGAAQPRYVKALPVVITAALCDTLLISLAVTGVSMIILGSDLVRTLLISIGVLFLLYMGGMTWKSKPERISNGTETSVSTRRQILFAASVSLFNPHAIMDTIGVIGVHSLTYQGIEKYVFAAATILVSWLWFFGLSVAGRVMGKLDSDGRLLRVINRVSAIIMWGAAIYLLRSLI